ncbi:MAG: glycosyltransferase [Pirellulales bacterium]|nr:glycosyltransferase [Pirellulales bacterium]
MRLSADKRHPMLRPSHTPQNQASQTQAASSAQQLVCVLMPVYNERYRVRDAVAQVLAADWPAMFVRHLVIVDDGSTDGTRDILHELVATYPGQITLIEHDVNQGKGAAIRTAIRAAEGDFAVIQDADLEYDPHDCVDMLELLASGKADVVYGSRFASSPRRRVLYYWHSLGNRVLTTLCNMLADLNLTDMETCYKAFRLELLKSIPIRCARFGIEPELTMKVAKRDVTIYEVPVSYYGRTYAEGKKITAWDGVKAIATLLRFWIIDDLYTDEYGQAELHRLTTTHRYYRWMADALRPHVGQHVLEIGASLGSLMLRLLPREQYVAAEAESLPLRYLGNRFARHPHVEVRSLDPRVRDDFAACAGQFDTVIAVHHLEHMDDDRQALDNLRLTLADGGRALLVVPRGRWLFGSLDEVLGHRRRYEREELLALATATGFAVEKIVDFNRAGVPGWALNARLLKRQRFSRVQLKLYDSLVWLVRRIDRLLPWKGLSWIVVLRRQDATDAA